MSMSKRYLLSRLASALFSLLSLLLFGEPSFAQQDGRLFLQPALIVELERRRLGLAAVEPVVEQPVEIEQILQEELPVEDVVIRFGGAMLSVEQGNRVWLNGMLLEESELPETMSLVRHGGSGGVLLVRGEGNRREYFMKAGQVLNLTAGDLYESYEWDRIEQAAAEVAAAAASDSC